MQRGMAARRRVRVRAYRAGRAMTANGRQVLPGDLVLGAHRSPNLAECLQLGYLIPVEEAELSDEEREAVEQEALDHIEVQRQAMVEEQPGLKVGRVGDTPAENEFPDAPDVILQDSGRVAEVEAGAPIVERARRIAEQDRESEPTRTHEAHVTSAGAPPEEIEELDEEDQEALDAALARQESEQKAKDAEAVRPATVASPAEKSERAAERASEKTAEKTPEAKGEGGTAQKASSRPTGQGGHGSGSGGASGSKGR
jgi:hypothetical protein